MGFGGEPKTEIIMRIKCLECLLKGGEEGNDEVQVLEAQPLPFGSSFLQQLECHVILVAAHGEFLEVVSTNLRLGEFLKFLGGI
jgi:hypothetical protein